jgi:HAE1 family hydrophobic/amphiphilic exporter-1
VKYTYATVNTGFVQGKNKVNIFVQLVPRKERKRSQSELTKPMRERLARIAGIELQQIGAFKTFSSGKPLQVSILGQERKVLGELAEQVIALTRAIPGAVDVESSDEAAKPQVSVELKRELASDLGIWRRPGGGAAAAAARRPGGRQLARARRPVLRRAGAPVARRPRARRGPAARAARLEPAGCERLAPHGQPARDRQHLAGQRSSADQPQGTAARSADHRQRVQPRRRRRRERAARKLDRIPMPPGYRYTMGGSSKDIQESFAYAVQALALAVVFIYLILASQFGSFIQPVAIMMSLPLSLIGVVLALILFRSTLNIFSIIGFIMLMGLVTKNAILLVDFVNQERRRGQAAARGGARGRAASACGLS